MSMEIRPFGHALQKLIQWGLVYGGVPQKVEGGTELLPKVGLQLFK